MFSYYKTYELSIICRLQQSSTKNQGKTFYTFQIFGIQTTYDYIINYLKIPFVSSNDRFSKNPPETSGNPTRRVSRFNSDIFFWKKRETITICINKKSAIDGPHGTTYLVITNQILKFEEVVFFHSRHVTTITSIQFGQRGF